tara:strand:- start:611 stop:2029 length:1419 start_codon:yes stop_codon:yes gene_type:complete
MITLDEREFRKKIISEVNTLLSISSATKGGLVEKTSLVTKDPLQSILFLNTKRSVSSSVVRPIILEACVNAEKTSGKSGKLCLNLTLELLNTLLRSHSVKANEKDFLVEVKNELTGYFNECRYKGFQPTLQSLKRIISQSPISENSKDIIRVCFDLAGKSRKVLVDKHLKSETSIILENGYNFSLEVDPIFLGKKNYWKEKNVKCCIVDGTVLEVSEIHHLLEEASENKEPYILFAREFSPEVLKTVSYNFIRGTINVVLVSVPLKESLLNTLVDIATVCGTDVVSSIKGDLISSAVRNKLVEVDKVSCLKGIISIENSQTTSLVKNHVLDIQSRISDIDVKVEEGVNMTEAYEKKKQMLSDRISTLISSSVSVRIGTSDIASNRSIVEEIDSTLRQIVSHNDHGYFKKKDLLDISNSYSEKIGKSISRAIIETYETESIIPAAALYASIVYSLSAIQSLCSIGCVLFYSDI